MLEVDKGLSQHDVHISLHSPSELRGPLPCMA